MNAKLKELYNDLYWESDELSQLIRAVEEKRYNIEKIRSEIIELGGDPDSEEDEE